MKVSELMKFEVFTVRPDDMVDRVFFLLSYEKIRHLPVLQGNEVVGIVSDRDLYKALGPRSRRHSVVRKGGETALYVIPRRVRHIMRRGVITVEPDADAAKAATMMARKKIGALPVVKKGKLVGIVTATDILLAFARMMRQSERAERSPA